MTDCDQSLAAPSALLSRLWQAACLEQIFRAVCSDNKKLLSFTCATLCSGALLADVLAETESFAGSLDTADYMGMLHIQSDQQPQRNDHMGHYGILLGKVHVYDQHSLGSRVLCWSV